MSARLATALALASMLSLSSCLDYEEDLTIHKDLSGEAIITLTLPDTLISKYEKLGIELDNAKLTKRFDAMSGVSLIGYENSGGRKPVIKMQIKFSSIEKLNEAIAANKPAGIWGGQFTVTKENGVTRIERKIGVGDAGTELPDFNYANYKTHYDGNIIATNSGQYNSSGQDVRYRYKLTDMVVQHPSQVTSLKKSWPWGVILACLVLVAGAAWYGWEYFGKKKPAASPAPASGPTNKAPANPTPPGPAPAPEAPQRPGPPKRPGPPQPRKPGAPPQ